MPDCVTRARITIDSSLLADGGEFLCSRSIGGVPLLTRHLMALRQAGVTSVELETPAAARAGLAERMTTVRAISGLTVRVVGQDSDGDADEPCVVLSADLLVDPRLIEQLVHLAPAARLPLVCVDRFDRQYPAEAKSPFVSGAPGGREGSLVEEASLAADHLTPLALRVEAGVSRHDAAESAPATFLDVGRYYWHRVRSDADIAEAVSKILMATIKPTDGTFARTNRRVSMRISRRLLETPATPNLVTLVTLLCSLWAGWVMAGGSYWAFVAGAFLMWFASMLDGVDGELARAKFQASELGHWLEMACDYGFYFALVGGYSVGLFRSTGNDQWLNLGIFGAVGVVLSFLVVARNKLGYARREPHGEYYVAFQRTVDTRSSNPVYAFTRHCGFFVTRGTCPYFIFLFNVLGASKLMFIFVLLGAHLSWTLPWYASRLGFTLRPAARPGTPAQTAVRSMRPQVVDEG